MSLSHSRKSCLFPLLLCASHEIQYYYENGSFLMEFNWWPALFASHTQPCCFVCLSHDSTKKIFCWFLCDLSENTFAVNSIVLLKYSAQMSIETVKNRFYSLKIEMLFLGTTASCCFVFLDEWMCQLVGEHLKIEIIDRRMTETDWSFH